MSEYLTVRLSSRPTAPIQWLVWSSTQNEVIASGELASTEPLSTLCSHAKERITIALISGLDTHFHEVEIPTGGNRQFMTILPYLIEDEIAQDVDKLHFHILHKEGNKAHICAIDKAYLIKWIEAFNAVGIEITKVLPDLLALPVLSNKDDAPKSVVNKTDIQTTPNKTQNPKASNAKKTSDSEPNDKVSALKIGDEWLFRRNANQVIAVDNTWFELFCNSSWLGQTDTICSYTPLPKNADKRWQLIDQPLVMELLTTHAINSKINLLPTQFKRKSSWLGSWQIWKKTAMAAALLLFSFCIKNTLETQSYQDQAQAYRIESERIFRTIFPNKNRIPTVSYLKREMNNEVNRLSGNNTNYSLLAWLNDLSNTIKAIPDMEVQSIKYDANRNEIRLQAQSSQFETFEAVRSKLAEKFHVEQKQLNRDNDVVYGGFILSLLDNKETQ